MPFSAFKPYPHCRVLHTVFDVMGQLQEANDIEPEEIESIHVLGEGFIERPVWQNQTIERALDAQFSVAHGLALAAHRVVPGKDWQDPELIHSPSVLDLMKRVRHDPHPDFVDAIRSHPSSRPTRVEIRARGQVFVGEKLFPKGVASPDPDSYMTNEELIEKFRHNASEVLTVEAIDDAIDTIMNLEKCEDMSRAMAPFVNGALERAA